MTDPAPLPAPESPPPASGWAAPAAAAPVPGAAGFVTDISKYESVNAEILQQADTLSAGIIPQLPQKFAP